MPEVFFLIFILLAIVKDGLVYLICTHGLDGIMENPNLPKEIKMLDDVGCLMVAC